MMDAVMEITMKIKLSAELQYSPIRPIFIPDLANALSADCAPGPGVFVLKHLNYRLVTASNKQLTQAKQWKDNQINNF